jgi:F-type H+-transporting ATPase subunit epsilon
MSLKLLIVSPEKKLYEGDVDYIAVSTYDGEIGIMRNHAPLVSELGIGLIKYKEKNSSDVQTPYIIEGGFVKVKDNDVLVLSHQVYSRDEIQLETEKEKLQELLKKKTYSDAQYIEQKRALDYIRKKIKIVSQ